MKVLCDDQIADLIAGRGMGLALAAELNSYPGPSHVLELGDALGLTEKRRVCPGIIHVNSDQTLILLETFQMKAVPAIAKHPAENSFRTRFEEIARFGGIHSEARPVRAYCSHNVAYQAEF